MEAVSSVLVLCVNCGADMLEMLGGWFMIWRNMPVISRMLRSSEVRRSSIEGIAVVASDHIDALSWKRSLVSGSWHSILLKDPISRQNLNFNHCTSYVLRARFCHLCGKHIAYHIYSPWEVISYLNDRHRRHA